MNAVAGSTITVAVLIKDNSATVSDPNNTASPIWADQVTVTLYTPSGASPVQNGPLTRATTLGTGVYTYTYNSSISDETGKWYHSFFAASGNSIGYSPRQVAFVMLPNMGPQGPTIPVPSVVTATAGFRGFALAPPTTGTYQTGDWFRNAAPVSGSASGWT